MTLRGSLLPLLGLLLGGLLFGFPACSPDEGAVNAPSSPREVPLRVQVRFAAPGKTSAAAVTRLRISAFELRDNDLRIERADLSIDIPDTATRFRAALRVPPADRYLVQVRGFGPAGGGNADQLLYQGEVTITDVQSGSSATATVDLSPVGRSLSGIVRHVNGSFVADASVKVLTCDGAETGNLAFSGPDGSFFVPVDSSGSYFLNVIRSGCLDQRYPAEGCLEVGSGGIADLVVVLTCTEGIWASVTLIWGERPPDLDLHLWTPEIAGEVHHVSWEDEGSIESVPFAQLDHDERLGFGPENITIHRSFPGTYTVAVHDFEDLDEWLLRDSEAQARVVTPAGRRDFSVPSGNEESGTWWHICTINGSNGSITPINRLSNSPPVGPVLLRTSAKQASLR